MKITLNGPPDTVCEPARIPVPPDKALKPRMPISSQSQVSTPRNEIEVANESARMSFPSISDTGSEEVIYRSLELKPISLAPVIKPAAKATMSMSFLF